MTAKKKRRRSRGKPKASESVLSEWLRRVEAEYRSAAITQELTLWLIQIGASPDLIADGMRIVKDELEHAEMSNVVYRAGGGTAAPQIRRESLSLPRRPRDPLEYDVLRVGVDVFCLGETVAVRLFKELRDPCTVPAARRALDRILRDEVRHRDFGWTLLEWMLDLAIGPELDALARRELPGMLRRIRSSYAPASAHGQTTIPADDLAWGLMPTARYPAILERTHEKDYVPRFRRVGIDAEAAWRASGRGTPTATRASPASRRFPG